jgi:hypothetical protein
VLFPLPLLFAKAVAVSLGPRGWEFHVYDLPWCGFTTAIWGVMAIRTVADGRCGSLPEARAAVGAAVWRIAITAGLFLAVAGLEGTRNTELMVVAVLLAVPTWLLAAASTAENVGKLKWNVTQ